MSKDDEATATTAQKAKEKETANNDNIGQQQHQPQETQLDFPIKQQSAADTCESELRQRANDEAGESDAPMSDSNTPANGQQQHQMMGGCETDQEGCSNRLSPPSNAMEQDPLREDEDSNGSGLENAEQAEGSKLMGQQQEDDGDKCLQEEKQQQCYQQQHYYHHKQQRAIRKQQQVINQQQQIVTPTDHQQQQQAQVPISADYLAQLIKDKKQLNNFPSVFIHLQRLIDEEINKVRQSLFQLNDVVNHNEPLELPEPEGEVVQLQEKIYVPVDEHPEYNFVGRILGPRGMTAKQLEQETGCKIMIRGRGSMRDKKKEGQNRGKANWEHLNDELHVLITVEDTQNRAQVKLKRALEEVKQLLVPIVDGEDELKKRQLMELAIINGTYRDCNYNEALTKMLNDAVYRQQLGEGSPQQQQQQQQQIAAAAAAMANGSPGAGQRAFAATLAAAGHHHHTQNPYTMGLHQAGPGAMNGSPASSCLPGTGSSTPNSVHSHHQNQAKPPVGASHQLPMASGPPHLTGNPAAAAAIMAATAAAAAAAQQQQRSHPTALAPPSPMHAGGLNQGPGQPMGGPNHLHHQPPAAVAAAAAAAAALMANPADPSALIYAQQYHEFHHYAAMAAAAQQQPLLAAGQAPPPPQAEYPAPGHHHHHHQQSVAAAAAAQAVAQAVAQAAAANHHHQFHHHNPYQQQQVAESDHQAALAYQQHLHQQQQQLNHHHQHHHQQQQQVEAGAGKMETENAHKSAKGIVPHHSSSNSHNNLVGKIKVPMNQTTLQGKTTRQHPYKRPDEASQPNQ